MPVIVELRDDIIKYLRTHGLWKKWLKAKRLFESITARIACGLEMP